MHKNTLIKILQWGLIAIVVATPLFYLKEGIYPYIFSKTLFFQAITEIVFGVWLALAYSYKEFRPKKTPLLLGVGIFTLLLFVTALVGVDFARSFWSTQERMFGIFAWLHIVALFVILQSCAQIIPWRRLMTASLLTAVVVSGLAITQLWYPNILLTEAVGDRPGATFGNPTFFAGYLLAHMFLCMYLFLKNATRIGQNKQENILLISALAVFAVALLNTQTRGDIAGLGIGIFAMIVWFAVFPPAFPTIKKVGRGVYLFLSVIVVVSATFFFFTRISPLWQKVPGLSRIASTSFTDADTIPRRAAWSAAWQGFKDHPIKGVGWENFNVIFNQYYDPHVLQAGYQETRFDKPHNTWLEYLVTGGVSLFLAYLALSALFLYEAYRVEKRLLAGVVFGGIVAYHIRNIVVFETLGPVLMVAVLGAYIDGLWWKRKQENEPPQQGKGKKHEDNPNPVVIGLFMGICLLPVYFINYQSNEASYYQYYGLINVVKNKFPPAIQAFRLANGIWSPYDWNLQKDYARAVAQIYFYSPDKISKEEVVYGVSQMELAVAAHPNDAITQGTLVDIYNQVYDINPEEYGRLAEEHGNRSLELSPSRQELYYSLSKTKTLQKDYKGALALLDKALAVAPDIAESQFYYGIVAYADNQPESGYAHIKKALELGRVWRNNNEARVAGNFFAQSGHIDEAIELYKKALQLNGDDIESRLKLGIAYYAKGDNDQARVAIQKAITLFDITKSPSYQEVFPLLKILGLDPKVKST